MDLETRALSFNTRGVELVMSTCTALTAAPAAAAAAAGLSWPPSTPSRLLRRRKDSDSYVGPGARNDGVSERDLELALENLVLKTYVRPRRVMNSRPVVVMTRRHWAGGISHGLVGRVT